MWATKRLHIHVTVTTAVINHCGKYLKIHHIELNHKTTHRICLSHLISSHLSLNRKGRWGTTGDVATSFLHFSLFFTALWDLAHCRPVPDVVFPPLPLSALSSSPVSLCLARLFLPDLMNGRHEHTTAVCVSLRW